MGPGSSRYDLPTWKGGFELPASWRRQLVRSNMQLGRSQVRSWRQRPRSKSDSSGPGLQELHHGADGWRALPKLLQQHLQRPRGGLGFEKFWRVWWWVGGWVGGLWGSLVLAGLGEGMQQMNSVAKGG